MTTKIKLIDGDGELPAKGEYLIKVPYRRFGTFAAKLDKAKRRPRGLVPPYSTDIQFNARCMSTVRDHFPHIPVYAPILDTDPRLFIHAAHGAAFIHFILPWVEPWHHFYQQVHDLLEHRVVHIAGGDPDQPGWTWSEEGLFD